MSDATLRAYRINEYDVFAGRDLEEAIAAAMRVTGCSREETYDEMYATCQPPHLTVKTDDGETTIGAILAEMTEPGPVCGYGD